MKVPVIVIACALSPLAAAAQPSITGTAGSLVHGNAVTLTGTAFGTKAAAAPQKYDDFSSGTPGAELSAIDWFRARNAVGGQGAYPTYTNARLRHARNTRSARANFVFATTMNYTYLSTFGVNGAWIANGIYIDTWMYLDYGGTDGVDYSRNHKPIRVHAGSEAFPNLYLGYWNPDFQSSMVLDQDDLDVTPAASKTQFINDLNADSFENRWTHFQMYLVQSTVNTPNGIAWLRVDGVVKINRTNMINRDTSPDGNNPWAQVLFGNYMGHDALAGQGGEFNFSGFTDWSDVYLDSTASRVEVCSSATYNSASNHCEIQVPTSWSDTSITFTTKQGSFGGVDAAFVFVCNAANVCSAGQPMTFGGTLPTKVTNLRIQPGGGSE